MRPPRVSSLPILLWEPPFLILRHKVFSCLLVVPHHLLPSSQTTYKKYERILFFSIEGPIETDILFPPHSGNHVPEFNLVVTVRDPWSVIGLAF